MPNGSPTPAGPAARVLDAADRLFYEQGYGATGVNEIVAEAGVAKASLYQHYPAKSDIALAYLDRRAAAWTAELEAEVARHRVPRRRALACFDFLARWLPENGFRGCAFVNLAAEFPDASSAVREHARRTKEATRRRMAELAQEASAAGAGDTLFLLFEGATVQAQLATDLWPVHAAKQAAAALLPPSKSG